MMYGAHPAIEGLHALRMPWRHRPRPDPDRARWSQSPEPVSVRHRDLAQCPGQEPVQRPRLDALVHEVSPDKIGLYLDWRTQEVGIAAARSGDEQLAEDYLAGDIYHALAVMCGLTNQDAKSWKATPEGKSQRQRMKALQLGDQLRHGRDDRCRAGSVGIR